MPPNPTGNFVVPDVTINAYTPVTIEVEGRNVPVGKTVQLTVMPETGEIQVVNTSPLEATGTEGITKATAEVTFQHGFSWIFVQASLAASP